MNPTKKTVAGRRKFLGLLPAILLAACGGHGDDEVVTVTPPPESPVSTGLLVYRSGQRIGVYDLASKRETLFAPQGMLIEGTGVSVSPQRKIAVLENRSQYTYDINTYDVQGSRVHELRYFVERTFVVGSAALSPDGRWSAVARFGPLNVFGPPFTFSVLIFEMTVRESEARLFILTAYTDPVWAGSMGELMARNSNDGSLHLFSTGFSDLGPLPGVRVDDTRAGYDVSADGRRVVFLRDGTVRMLDRADGTQWEALRVATGTLTQPAFTPDGTALLAVWHRSTGEVVVLVPWVRGFAVQVTEDMLLTSITTGQFDGRLSTAP